MISSKRYGGKSVFIRGLEASDLDRTHGWMHRPDISERIGVKIPFSLEDQLRWFTGLATVPGKYVFAVCRISDCVHIGNVSIDSIDSHHRNGRISIFIADGDNRCCGMGSDALQTLSRFAFGELGLHRIWCKTNANEPELFRFYTRNGFELEGCLRQHEITQGGLWRDKWVFGRLADS